MSDIIQLYASANIRIAELERENAALRDALHYAAKAYDDEKCTNHLASKLYDVSCVARAALYAVRKEAQP